MSTFGRMKQRPESFTLNRDSPLAKSLVFAGLGRVHGISHYRDSSPCGNHGTLTGYTGTGDTPADRWRWVPQLGRWGLGFDGSDDWVRLPNGTIAGYPLTYSVWFWTSALNLGKRMLGAIIEGASGTSYDGFYFSLNNAVLAVESQQTTAASATFTVGAAGWHHVAFIVASATRRLVYLDGVAGTANTTNKAPVISAPYCSIGCYNHLNTSPGQFWLGSLDDPLLFTRELTPAEIAALADPSNVDLRVGGTPLILPPRRCVFASAGAAPTGNRRRRFLVTCGA